MTCAVCKDSSTASKANKMLVAKASVRDVAAAVNISKSAVDRHKRNCLTKAEVYQEPAIAASPQAKPLAKVDQPAQAATLVIPEPYFPIATAQDYDRCQQWFLDKIIKAIIRAEADPNPRMLLTATKEGREQLNSIGKRKGFIQDTTLNDNRQVNIFQGLSVEAMTSLRDSLRQALQPAMVTIEQE